MPAPLPMRAFQSAARTTHHARHQQLPAFHHAPSPSAACTAYHVPTKYYYTTVVMPVAPVVLPYTSGVTLLFVYLQTNGEQMDMSEAPIYKEHTLQFLSRLRAITGRR
eukprot:226564-Pyramimonas_sp.AAC.1